MTRINLVSAGFVRSPADDFTDDGNRFTCYRCSKVMVSKLVADGMVYISGHSSIDNRLPYEVYSKLPHYRNLDNLNGVSLNMITEAHIAQFAEDCKAYEQEYEQAANEIKYPTVAELEQKARERQLQAIDDFKSVEQLIIDNPMALVKIRKASTYEFNRFFDYLVRLEETAKAKISMESMIGTARSINYMKEPIEQSWFASECHDIFAKYAF